MLERKNVSETKEFEIPPELPLPIRWTMKSRNAGWNAQLEKLANASRSDFPILLLGPSGSGKDVLARTSHDFSHRRNSPFVSVNCSTLTESLIESELFGHIKGAFTGALMDRKGAFESARGGSLFLDEIGDLPINMQAKLLRALENQEIRPVGSDKVLRTDVRILAATHQDLRRKIQLGQFREDLYYRLNVISIRVPSLVERLDDFEMLVQLFCRQYRVDFSNDAMTRLKSYDWPGNIRELKNVVARSSALFPQQTVEDYMLLPLLDLQPAASGLASRSKASGSEMPLFDRMAIRELEEHLIRAKLKKYNGNQRKVALALGLPKSTLNDRIRNYGIDCGLFRNKVVKNFLGTSNL